MPRRVTLTDALIRSLQPAPDGRRYEVMDALLTEFGVRVTDRGAKSFIVYRRWPGNPRPARRTVGDAAKMKLSAARQKARDWLLLVDDGKDPKAEERRARLAEQRRRLHTFGAMAEDWFLFIRRSERRHADVEASIRREFIPAWKDRPVVEITDEEIARLIQTKARSAERAAHHMLTNVKRLFKWAYHQPGRYGLDASPAAHLAAKALIGKRNDRTRVLTDAELGRVWHAAVAQGYPYGDMVRMLALTGQRRNEVAEARWPEIDMKKRLWTIPGERMKGEASHVVPICDDLLALLSDLPRFNAGGHLFSTTSGTRPVSSFSHAKRKLDELAGEMPGYTFHDIRRTFRTGLSALPIEAHVRERMIAHVQPGVEGTYDLYAYTDEKRRGFELWERRLRRIVATKVDGGAAG